MYLTVSIIRNYLPHQTQGVLLVHENSIEIFKCLTLELPWKLNLPQISCIPVGMYIANFMWSPKFKKRTYLLLNVPNRAGIRIHSGNYASAKISNVQGCILLGDSFQDINRDGIVDIVNSRATVQAFEKVLKGKDCVITIYTS